MDPTFLKYSELIATGLGSFIFGILGALYKARRDTSAALAEAAQHATPQEIIDLLNEIKQATDAASPGGQEITDAEALQLGLAVWQAFRD